MTFHLFNTGGIEIRIHVLAIPVILLCVALDMTKTLLLTLLALLLHEMCHVITAKKLGVAIYRIEIMPCGFTAHMSNTLPLSDELAIASSGVLFSLVSGALGLTLMTLTGFESEILTYFSLTSITLALMNFLPVVPLDGGRILRSILKLHLSSTPAGTICIFTGFVISAAIIAIGVIGLYMGYLNFSVTVIGLLMLTGSFAEMKREKKGRLRDTLQRANTLASGKSPGVCTHAFHEDTSVKNVISEFSNTRFNVVYVLNSELLKTALLTETEIRMYGNREGATLHDVVNKNF